MEIFCFEVIAWDNKTQGNVLNLRYVKHCSGSIVKPQRSLSPK